MKYLAAMLLLSEITLFQFKNYVNRTYRFGSRVQGICGPNGTGKTNLLDAIYYLCFTKSYFTRTDAQNVLQGSQGFRIEGSFERNGSSEKASCVLRETGRKEFKINDQPYDKFARHIGRYPCVIIAPDDAVLITGGSEERRRFMDSLLSQLDPLYLQHLMSYNKLLQQRNSLLKQLQEQRTLDISLLDVLDLQLIAPAQYIFDQRRDLMVSFLPAVRRMYQQIARQSEEIQLIYESQLFYQSMESLLTESRTRDLAAGRTLAGPHRDELDVQFHGQPFRNIASQGQRKSLLFALKLTEMDWLRKEKGFDPILLLDDIFEKLDENRIANLLRQVCVEHQGQVFITDTNASRLEAQLRNLQVSHEILELSV